VSIGGGTTKLVAKLAVELAKPKPGTGATGVHVVPPGDEAEFMRRFALADIPSVGPRFQERLAAAGLRTVNDVLERDADALVRAVGEREAHWLHDRVRGIDDSAVEEREVAKSISRDETFSADLGDDASLERELLRLAQRAAADLREDGLSTRTITVRIRDRDFRTRQASRTLPERVESDRAVFTVARELLRKLRRARRVPARLLGVALSGLDEEPAPTQLGLFAAAPAEVIETERDRTVSRTLDKLRAKFGPDAIAAGRVRDDGRE
jgi:DNA polymerase-4